MRSDNDSCGAWPRLLSASCVVLASCTWLAPAGPCASVDTPSIFHRAWPEPAGVDERNLTEDNCRVLAPDPRLSGLTVAIVTSGSLVRHDHRPVDVLVFVDDGVQVAWTARSAWCVDDGFQRILLRFGEGDREAAAAGVAAAIEVYQPGTRASPIVLPTGGQAWRFQSEHDDWVLRWTRSS